MLNIKRIFETIADAGQKILEKKSIKSIALKKDLLDLCDDLLSTKGAAFGITLARDILFRYQNLSLEDKNKFLIQVNDNQTYIQIFPETPIPLNKDNYAVVMKIFNPRKRGMFQFQALAQTQRPGEVPISTYIGTWNKDVR